MGRHRAPGRPRSAAAPRAGAPGPRRPARVETQDIDSRFARATGAAWHHFKHAEHILHFTPSTARRLLEASGFRVEELTHRYGGKYVAPSFIAERAGRVHPALSRMLAPLERLGGRRLYLNFMDEMVLRARPA